MNSDGKEDYPETPEDALYATDYDEDTIDYDLDTDKLLDEEPFEPTLTIEWGSEAPQEEPEFAAEQEYNGTSEHEPNIEPAPKTESEETWYDDEDPDEAYVEPWPVGLIAVAAIALLLLAAGGYGVIQQRGAMQDEIRQLQSALATTSSNVEVATSRQAQRALEAENDGLRIQLGALLRKNQNLQNNLDNLMRPAVSNAVAEKADPEPEQGQGQELASVIPTPELEPSAESPTIPDMPPTVKSVPVNMPWFVNFGSYTQEAVADSWASRLRTDDGEVAVVPGKKGDTHYFRVRVINLPNREIAEKIAHQLEQTYNLPRLWIGKQ